MIIRVLENGDLELSLEDSEEPETGARVGYWSVMAELFEPFSTNGSFTHFDASVGNPFVGLSSAPCIAESMDIDENGAATIEGRFWYFGNYMLECDLETLTNSGRVVYTLAIEEA